MSMWLRECDWLTVMHRVFWGSLLILGMVGVLYVLSVVTAEEPFGHYSEAVVSEQTPEYITVRQDRCNNLDRDIFIISTVSFQYVNGFEFAIPAVQSVGTFIPPGCSEFLIRYHIPREVLFPGTWRLVGYDVFSGYRSIHIQEWSSNTFEVRSDGNQSEKPQ